MLRRYAMHVAMYIDTLPNRDSPPSVLLRLGWPEGGKICKRTLANLKAWPAHKVELLRRLLRDDPLRAPEDAFAIERSIAQGHAEAVLAAIRHLGIETLLGANRSPERFLIVATSAERVINPCSKLATTRPWHCTTLAHTAAQIGKKVGKVAGRHKIGKHFALSAGGGRLDFVRRDRKRLGPVPVPASGTFAFPITI